MSGARSHGEEAYAEGAGGEAVLPGEPAVPEGAYGELRLPKR